MKHITTITRAPQYAVADIPVSILLSLIQALLAAFRTFIEAKAPDTEG